MLAAFWQEPTGDLLAARQTTYLYYGKQRRSLELHYSHKMLELYLDQHDGKLLNRLKPAIAKEVASMKGDETLEKKVWSVCCLGLALALELEGVYVPAIRSTSIPAEVSRLMPGPALTGV